MKILQIVHGFLPYPATGTEVYTHNISKALVKKGNEVFVFCRVNTPGEKEYGIVSGKLQGLIVFTVNNTFRRYDSFEDTYRNEDIATGFASVLDEIKPDIIHVQHLLYLGAQIISQAKERNIPILFTLNDYWLICPQGQLLRNNKEVCAGVNSNQCLRCIRYQLAIGKNTFKMYYMLKEHLPAYFFEKIKKLYLDMFAKKRKTHGSFLLEKRQQFISQAISMVDIFISPSIFLKNKFIGFGIPENKIIHLDYGFDLNRASRSNRPLKGLRFGFIGNLLPAKGAHVLIDAFKDIKKDNVVLKIYGRACSYKSIIENYENRIRAMCAKENKNIIFMGGFDNKDIASVLSDIDILIVPSIWQENAPLVIREAFIANIPVIASDIGGIPEFVADGVNGLLFKAGSAEDLRNKINTIIQNPHLIEDLKSNITLPKGIDENADEIIKIYKDLA
jgi:glycosyltransferase involved in cell wall biosynthesis